VIRPNTTAVVHVHPADWEAEPSDNDIAIADKYKIGMYVQGRNGLYFYQGGSGKKPVLVQQN